MTADDEAALAENLRVRRLKRGMSGRLGMPEFYFLAVTLLVIWLCLTPYFRAPGVPISHETLSYLLRTAIYADHFRQGDFFPLWASEDAFGMGSPLPLFYHKTFYYVSGCLSILLGSIESGVVASLAMWMLVGAYGMRIAAGKLTDNLTLQLSAPQAFLLSNYCFTDWLVRGAMAEFTAMMLVPWLAGWCLMLVRDGRFSLSITPILYLLVQSHNITALFGMIAISFAAVIFVWLHRAAGVRRVWRHAIASVLAFWLLLAPQLIVQKVMLADYDPGKITQLGYKASENFQPALRYFWDRQHAWLSDWAVFTVQIDFGIWIAALLVAVALALRPLVQGRGVCNDLRRQQWTIAFLAATLLAFLLLQFRISAGVYVNIPLLQFLQFPWRLMAYITPLGILLVVVGLDLAVKHQRLLAAVSVAWAASFLALSPLPHRFGYPFVPQEKVDDLLVQRDTLLTGTVLQGIGEYYPRVYDARGKEMTGMETARAYQVMHDEARQLQVLTGSCEVRALHATGGTEALARRFEYRCGSDSLVALPVSYSRLLRVENETMRERLAYHRQPGDPRVRLQLESGHGTLIVKLPSVGSLAQSGWRTLSGN